MFEIPEAKRIRRDEIVSPSSSPRSSPDIDIADNEEAHAILGKLLAFDISTLDTAQNTKTPKTDDTIQTQIKDAKERKPDNNEDDEQEFEFRLFSAPKKTAATGTANTDLKHDKQKADKNSNIATPDDTIQIQKLRIRIRSPTPGDVAQGDGRFIVPFRGWKYYFTKPELMHITVGDDQEQARLEAEELSRRRQYEGVAVTGAEVFQWAQTMETAGCHLPWRVIRLDSKRHKVPKTVPLSGSNTRMQTQIPSEEKEKRRSNPGKKRRIILRTRAAAAAAAAAAVDASSNMTEAEKRNKKNREKKIRKRQRERAKKAALATSTGLATPSASLAVTASVDGNSSDES